MADSKPKLPQPSEIEEPQADRRGFLTASAFVTGAICALAPVGAAAVFVLDPLLRKKDSGDSDLEGFVAVATLDEIPPDGTPFAAPVIADKRDAWNLERNAELGSVYLRKVGENIICFSAKCPHLGCFVQYRDNQFHCPCHDSQFDIEGNTTNDTPPRAMDALEVKVVDNEVLVKYIEYRTGSHDKIAVWSL
jgi:menaquinol-cytochrome c reductase iron-sulfur subunit